MEFEFYLSFDSEGVTTGRGSDYITSEILVSSDVLILTMVLVYNQTHTNSP